MLTVMQCWLQDVRGERKHPLLGDPAACPGAVVVEGWGRLNVISGASFVHKHDLMLNRAELKERINRIFISSDDDKTTIRLPVLVFCWRHTILFGPEIWVKCKSIQAIPDNNYWLLYTCSRPEENLIRPVSALCPPFTNRTCWQDLNCVDINKEPT